MRLQLHGSTVSPLWSQQLRLPGSGSCHAGNKALFIPFQATKWFQLKSHVLFTEAGVVQVKHEGTLDHSDPNLVRITVRSSWLSLLWFFFFFLLYSLGMSSWMWDATASNSRKRDHQNEEEHWDWRKCCPWLDQMKIWNVKEGIGSSFPSRTSDGYRRKVICLRGQRKEKINKEVCSAWGKTHTILSNGTCRCLGRIL